MDILINQCETDIHKIINEVSKIFNFRVDIASKRKMSKEVHELLRSLFIVERTIIRENEGRLRIELAPELEEMRKFKINERVVYCFSDNRNAVAVLLLTLEH